MDSATSNNVLKNVVHSFGLCFESDLFDSVFIITMSVVSEGQKIRTTLTFYYKRMKIKHREPLYLEKLTHAKNNIGMMLFNREVRKK